MRTPARSSGQPRQRRVELSPFVAPIGGWISNRALAQPNTDGPQGAAILENYFPTATGAIIRRGSAIYVQVNEGTPVRSIFKYMVGSTKKFFAANDDSIFDITTITNPTNYSVGILEEVVGEVGDDYQIGEVALGPDSTVWSGASGGDWHVVQFATTGGIFLVGVNGASVGFIYDGQAFYPNVPGGVWSLAYDGETVAFTEGATLTGGTSGATATILKVSPGDPGKGVLHLTGITGTFVNDEALTDSGGGAAVEDGTAANLVPGVTFPGGLTTADMAYVWVFKNTLWFVQKDSLSAWYLDVDQIGGDATEFMLGGEFGQGGSLLVGQSWSLSASGQGGLSDQCVFVSTEGEAVVYQGTHPSTADNWSKVGVYRIGAPLGRRGFIRAGGDLVFATTIGFVALSTAVQVDVAALSPRAVSYSIEDTWNKTVLLRTRNWVCALWPESQMVAIAPPTDSSEPIFLVSNARTGAWANFTNWSATCMEVYDGRLFYGTPDGYVVEAMVGGTDRGTPFTGTYMPLFTDSGKPTMKKVARMARVEIISATEINENVSCRFDFDTSRPPPPDVAPVPVGNEWDNATWDESVWSSERATIITERRHSVSGHGYRLSPILQITSGAAIPLDAQIVALDVAYEGGDVFT